MIEYLLCYKEAFLLGVSVGFISAYYHLKNYIKG
jgi:hypothetical protein